MEIHFDKLNDADCTKHLEKRHLLSPLAACFWRAAQAESYRGPTLSSRHTS